MDYKLEFRQILYASWFLFPGVLLILGAVANVSKNHRFLSSWGIVLYLIVGIALIAVGVAGLMDLAIRWVVYGHWGLALWLLLMGSSRIYLKHPDSPTLQWISWVGGIVLLAVLALGQLSQY
jgi:hypothetical protein